MSIDRSVYGTEPVYEHLSFCDSPDTLWRKLQSGGWDWLGVKPNERTFVLGAPRRPRSAGMAATGLILALTLWLFVWRR
jgi:hypothetical protein